MNEIVMPRLSDSMEEGTIIRWLKADGEAVGRGDELVEIETDKATMTYEADGDGLVHHVAREGDTLPIGAVIANLLQEGETATHPDGSATTQPIDPRVSGGEGESEAPSSSPDSQVLAAGASPPPATPNDDRVRASPLARRMARERGVDLHEVTGTGPRGRIVKTDVLASTRSARDLETPEASRPETGDRGSAKGSVTVTELTRTQALIARRMAESRATVPGFTLRATLDMSACVELRRAIRSSPGPTPSINDLVVKACAIVLRDPPKANGAYRDGRFERYGRVNVGIAVATEDSLVVPTIFDTDRKGLAQIASETRALAARVRSGEITPPELSGGTFTVSNLGMFGVRSFEAVINTPQAAILAVGALEQRPIVRGDEIVIADQMDVELACDHRILYGAEAAEFLALVRGILEAPLSLAL